MLKGRNMEMRLSCMSVNRDVHCAMVDSRTNNDLLGRG